MADLARPTELVVAWRSLSEFCVDCADKVGCRRVTLREVEDCSHTREQRRRDSALMGRGELPMLRGSAALHRVALMTNDAVVRRRTRAELEDVDEGPAWVEVDL